MQDNQTDSLTKRVEVLEVQLAELRNMIVTSKPTKRRTINDKEGVVVANIQNIGVQYAVIFCLLVKGKQSKEQMKNTLGAWGVPYGSWFDGGNFNNRLLKKGIAKLDSKNENGEEIYSLTMNGERVANEKLEGLEKTA